MKTLGVILAGGQGTRLGGTDKALISLNNNRLIDLVLRRLRPQVDAVVVCGPPRHDVDASFVEDRIKADEGGGPLAAIEAAFHYANQSHNAFDVLVTVPVDSPFFPNDLVQRLLGDETVSLVKTEEGVQSAFGCWPIAFATAFSSYVGGDNRMSIRAAAGALGCRFISFEPPEYFFNINRPEDIETAKVLASKYL